MGIQALCLPGSRRNIEVADKGVHGESTEAQGRRPPLAMVGADGYGLRTCKDVLKLRMSVLTAAI